MNRVILAAAAAALSLVGFAGTADENGVVPYYWYTFNGAYASIGANNLSFGGENGNSWVDTDATSGHKALQLKQGAALPWGGNLNRGSGDFTIVTVAKTADIESGVIWNQGGRDQGYSFVLATDGATGVYLRFFGSSWPAEVKDKTDALRVTKGDAATAYHVYTVSYDSTSKTWSLGVDLEQPMTVVADLNGFTSQNFQFGSVHGGMTSDMGMNFGNRVCLYEYRLYQKLLTKSQLAKVVKTYAAEFSSVVVQDKHTLEVDGFPEWCGEVSPGYGYTYGIPDGTNFVCSAPSGVDLGDDRFASCIGYTLYTNKLGTSDEWLPWKGGDEASFDYTHSAEALTKLVWNWKINAPLGVEKPSHVSSEFASSVVAANVTGIGKTAESATLTFHYGTTTACADGMVTVENVTNAGVWSGTLPRLIAGQTYYVKATLSNGKDTPVTTAVYDFVQPEVAEEGGEPSVPRGYVEMDSLTFDGNEYFMLPLTFSTADGFGFAMKANVSKRGSVYGPHIVNFGTINGSSFATTDPGSLWAVYRQNGLSFGDIPVSGSYPVTKDKDGNNIYPDDGIGHDIAIDFNVAGDGQNFVDGAIPETSITVATYCQPAIFIGSYGNAPNDSQYTLNGKLYYIRLYDHGTLKMNLVPCVKLGATEAENVVGFYDTENPDPATAFVANLGTGKVTAGEPALLACPALELRDGQFVVTASASDTLRSAYLYTGEIYGGTDGWGAAVETKTVAAGETTVEFDLPENWGETVWFARVKIGEGDDAIWSKTLIAFNPNLPSVSLDSLDGLGGDTLVVKGTVDSLGGASCTLKVCMGTSEDAITEEWTGLEGMTVTDTGDFTFTLFEGDTAASRYLKPGETYFVRVVATSANGKTAWSSVRSVKMAGKAAFKSQSATVSKRVMTVTASMADVGMMGKTMVELWVCEQGGALVKVAGPVEVTAVVQNFTLTYELPKYETPYTWQLRATNTSQGKTENPTTESEQKSQTAPDSATYTWTGEGADNMWTTAANWSDDKGGDCLHYPQTKNATAKFTTDADVEIDLPRSGTTVNLYSLDLGTKNIDVRFHSADTDSCGLVLSELKLTMPGQGSRWTIDHALVRAPSNYTMSQDSTIVVTNQANLYFNNYFQNLNSRLELKADSTMSVNDFFGGKDGVIVIGDSTFEVRAWTYAGYYGGSLTVRFEGTHPRWSHLHTGSPFKLTAANRPVILDFLIPEGGYEFVPLHGVLGKTMDNVFGGNANETTYPITVNVLDESPAARVDATLEAVPLIEWSKGINTNRVVEGTLPNELGQDKFVWSDETATPTGLSVKIVGSTHKDRLTVAGEPEQVLDDWISPAYGHMDGEASKTLTAPDGTLTVVEGARRATCAGWKLYDMNPATKEPVLPAVQSGTGRSYTWTTANKWQRFAWQWAIENKVTVTAVAGVTVQGDEHWAPQGGSVAIPAVCDPHVCVSAVEGGAFVDGAIVVSGVTGPMTVTMTTGHAWYVAADGDDDDNDGETPTTAFATVAKALGQAVAGDEIRVGAGVFAPSAQITLPQGVTLVGAGVGKTVFNGEGVNAVGFSVVAGATVKGISVVGYPQGGVTMTGGLVEGCVLVSNGLYGAKLTGGTLRNSLAYGNAATATTEAGVVILGGEVINCTLADNTNTADIAYSDLLQTGGTVKNTIARYATVTKGTADHNCFNEPVAFRNPAKGEYRLSAEAKNCINRGDNSVWDGVVRPRDLAGRDRIFLKGKRRDAAVDIGCYEFSPARTVIIMR